MSNFCLLYFRTITQLERIKNIVGRNFEEISKLFDKQYNLKDLIGIISFVYTKVYFRPILSRPLNPDNIFSIFSLILKFVTLLKVECPCLAQRLLSNPFVKQLKKNISQLYQKLNN